jgi:serine O-acetyltransferase
VAGDLTIGDDAKIGPNAVVTVDVGAGATAIARPSRIQRPPAPHEGAGPEGASLRG